MDTTQYPCAEGDCPSSLPAPMCVTRSSHLRSAEAQVLRELLTVEVMSPTVTRPWDPDLYDAPLLRFD